MLQAILLNKAGRNISSNEVHWRQIFIASEDSLTSTIFGTLRYLPNELFWRVLLNSCYNCPINKGENIIESFEYWAHWNAANATNANFIEPDLFIRTSKFDLIVEAKRYDHNQQYELQWLNEIQGYLNHYREDNKQVYLLAVGGISNEAVEMLQVENVKYCIIKSRWIRILKEVKILKNEVEKNAINFVNADLLLTILEDLIIGFRIHGYATGEWFENTKFNFMLNLSSFKSFNVPIKFKTFSWRLSIISQFRINDVSIKTLTNPFKV